MTVRGAAQREIIKREIQSTADKKGVITPEGVVALASDPHNPLHAEFEWNDQLAGHQHRLAVARALIREITYEVASPSKRIITEISYVHRPGSAQAYVPLSRVARSKKLAREVMLAELARCEGAIVRARQVADVLGLRDELDELLRELVCLKKRVGRGKDKGDDARPRPN